MECEGVQGCSGVKAPGMLAWKVLLERVVYSGVGIKWRTPLKFSVGAWDGQAHSLAGSFLCCLGHHSGGSTGDGWGSEK